MQKGKLLILGLIIGLFFLSTLVGSAYAADEEPWKMINWNEPVSMYERTMGDWYIPPEGWKEAIDAEGTESITLINSGAISGDPAMQLNIQYFEKLTGIDVKFEEVGEDDINAKQTAALSGKTAHYDLVFLTTFSEAIIDYAMRGWLMPLNMLWTDEFTKVYSQETINTFMFNDDVYGFPYIGMGMKLHYRKDLLEEAGFDGPPETWDELVEYAKKLTVDTNGDSEIDRWGFGYHAGPRYSTMMMFGQFLVSSGGSLITDGSVKVDTPEIIKALELLADLRNEYKVSPPGVNTYDYIQIPELFSADKLAMSIGPNWAYQVIQSNEEVYSQYEMTHFPVRTTDLDRVDSFFDFSYYGVSPYSKNKAAALLFLDFLRSYQGRHSEVYIERNVVPNKSVWEAEEVHLQVPYADLLNESVKQAKFWTYPNATKTIDILNEEIGYALLGNKSAEQAMKDAQSRIRRLR